MMLPPFENKSTNLSINQSTHYYLILLFFICDKKFLHKVLFSIKSLYWNLSQINSSRWTTSVYNLPNGIWYAIKTLPWNHNYDLTFLIRHGQGQGQALTARVIKVIKAFMAVKAVEVDRVMVTGHYWSPLVRVSKVTITTHSPVR